jgi:uncharacterized protein YlxP (DUF503 family)
MIIAALELTITFYATSLKEKRSVVRRVLARARAEFNVAANELDELDNPGGAVLGFCACGRDKRYLEGQLHALERFVDELELCEIVDSQRSFTVPFVGDDDDDTATQTGPDTSDRS